MYSYTDPSQTGGVTFNQSKRLLLLDGDNGTVACRVYGNLMSGTLPRFSEDGSLESATRSLLRMNNLTAVRGIRGASMVGPIDYLGNLEQPHKYLYMIQNGFPPIFHRISLNQQILNTTPLLKELDRQLITTVHANWISGKNKSLIEAKQAHYEITNSDLRHSLFLNPGLLEIDRKVIELCYFDPRDVDLSSFKARLVTNHTPFQITSAELPAKDDYRIVTYLYEPGYANWQVTQGSGLFLEKHRFSQTMTPITPDSIGFVTLARTNDHPNQLELIGVQIPYGYTLIIEKDCIHGDSTLNGFYMMGMTSDHTTMRTADTVFLKFPDTKENVSIIHRALENTSHQATSNTPPPLVIYKNATENERAEFKRLTNGQNFIFNPFSSEYLQ